MSFLRDMWATAQEVTALRQQLAFYQEQNNINEWKVEQLEKQVKLERTKHDKFVTVTMNQLCAQAKLPTNKYKDVEPDETTTQEEPPEEKRERVAIEEQYKFYAGQMRDADIEERGEENVQPLEYYVQQIKINPDCLSGVM